MKKLPIAVMLFAFTMNAFAENETKSLEELQKLLLSQSSVILKVFEKHKIDTLSGIYQDIWLAEFDVVDAIDIATNTVFLSKKSEKKDVNSRIYLILNKAGKFCSNASINLKYQQIEIKNKDVKVEVAKQAEYAKQSCDGIDKLRDLYK
jgi:hypothetical protein